MNGGMNTCGIGSLPLLVRYQCQLSVTGTSASEQPSSRQVGNSSSSARGSTTAPDKMCAPISEPFSSTQTLNSGLTCLSRIAVDSPAGPPPTITTSKGIDSRVVMEFPVPRALVQSRHLLPKRLDC